MRKIIAIVFLILILVLLVGCQAKTQVEADDTTIKTEVSSDVEEIDTLDDDMDISELDDLESDLDDLDW